MAELLPWYDHLDDVVYPTDNDFDIPALRLELAAPSVLGNVWLWGTSARQTPRPHDTYVFYTKDQKFTALIKHPESIVVSRCAAIVEPNFSTCERTRFPTGLYGIYLKRKIAYYVQTKGIKIVVDLTVHPKFADVNLLGVPEGWPSYAVRPNKAFGTSAWLVACYELARHHSGLDRPYFFVYGGGKAVRSLVAQYHWDHSAEYLEVVHGANR